MEKAKFLEERLQNKKRHHNLPRNHDALNVKESATPLVILMVSKD
jgi:hypothetical protein